MVTCDYLGRTGNQLFQYSFARLIAEKNGLEMGTEWPHQKFIKTTPHKQGIKIDGDPVVVRDTAHEQHDQDWHLQDFRNKRVHFHGFFQHPKFYDSNEHLIKSFFELDPVEKMPDNCVVMHVRLGDYASPGLRSVISPEWYGSVLKNNIKFNVRKHKLFIVCEEKDNPYFKRFIYYHPEIISQSAAEDFHFLRRFSTIICSNSSFAWWAAWLSDAKNIFTFSRWMRDPHGHIIRLAYLKRGTPVLGRWLS